MNKFFSIFIIILLSVNGNFIMGNKNKIIDNIFGTDGIRSEVGIYPLDKKSIKKLGYAIGEWAVEKYQTNNKIIKVLIAQDTRESCNSIISLLEPGLVSKNIVIENIGILPTPAAFYLSKKNNYNFSIIISASHNPAKDNGIKIIDNGRKIQEKDEKVITEKFYKQPDKIKNNSSEYMNFVIEQFKNLRLNNLTIALDTANGAQYKIAPKIFRALGAKIIVINNNPNGQNINVECGATHTEAIQDLVIKNQCDIGFAFDGDGDRVIAVNSKGQIKDGDDILALLSNNSDYINNKNLVATILSNYGLEKYLNSKNKNLIRTPVGDKYVAQELERLDANLGGEQSGHIILKNITNTGDGIIVALKVLETLELTGNKFIDYNKYPQVNINIPVKNKKDLTSSPLKDLIKETDDNIIGNGGRLIVRYSGTENLLRITAEAPKKDVITEQVFLLSNKLKQFLT